MTYPRAQYVVEKLQKEANLTLPDPLEQALVEAVYCAAETGKYGWLYSDVQFINSRGAGLPPWSVPWLVRKLP